MLFLGVVIENSAMPMPKSFDKYVRHWESKELHS